MIAEVSPLLCLARDVLPKPRPYSRPFLYALRYAALGARNTNPKLSCLDRRSIPANELNLATVSKRTLMAEKDVFLVQNSDKCRRNSSQKLRNDFAHLMSRFVRLGRQSISGQRRSDPWRADARHRYGRYPTGGLPFSTWLAFIRRTGEGYPPRMHTVSILLLKKGQ